jgi:hypothetical protein
MSIPPGGRPRLPSSWPCYSKQPVLMPMLLAARPDCASPRTSSLILQKLTLLAFSFLPPLIAGAKGFLLPSYWLSGEICKSAGWRDTNIKCHWLLPFTWCHCPCGTTSWNCWRRLTPTSEPKETERSQKISSSPFLFPKRWCQDPVSSLEMSCVTEQQACVLVQSGQLSNSSVCTCFLSSSTSLSWFFYTCFPVLWHTAKIYCVNFDLISAFSRNQARETIHQRKERR